VGFQLRPRGAPDGANRRSPRLSGSSQLPRFAEHVVQVLGRVPE
jgi:hypothetical protein